MGDNSKIAKGGITPRTRTHTPPRASRSVVHSRRRRTRPPLRVTILGEPRQKQVPPKAQTALTLPQDSQQVPTKRDPPRTPEYVRRKIAPCTKNQSSTDMGDNSKKAKVGHRRRQCTRPVLNSRSSQTTPNLEQHSKTQKLLREDAGLLPLQRCYASSGTAPEPLIRMVKSASAA
jgi:hypothetical protein